MIMPRGGDRSWLLSDFKWSGAERFVKIRDRFDAGKIVFQRQMLVRSMRIFVRQTESNQNAGHFESVVHLCDERDGTAFTNKNSLLPETFFEGGLSFGKNRRLKWSGPRLARTQYLKLADHGFRQQFADVFFHQLCDFLWVLIGYQPR